MKNLFNKAILLTIVNMAIILFLLCSCKKERVIINPEIGNIAISSISSSTATISINIASTGGAEIKSVKVLFTESSDVTILIEKINSNSYIATISNLLPNSTYSFIASATNTSGLTATKNDSFKTLGAAPEVSTSETTNLKGTTVTLNATVKANNISTTIVFEWGSTTSYGNTVVVETNKTIKNDTSVSVNLDKLTMQSTYHYRVKAQNAIGTTTGLDIQFTTPETVADPDGNENSIVTIGSQKWTAENYKATHFRDGSAIPNITVNSIWANTTQGAMCFINDGKNNHAIYNYLAAIDPKGLAPAGWHVATHADWVKLSNYMGGRAVAGGSLKQTGTSNWVFPNTGATNSTGFNAIPNPIRFGICTDQTYSGANWYTDRTYSNWLSVDPIPGNIVYTSSIDESLETHEFYNQNIGGAVRLVKDDATTKSLKIIYENHIFINNLPRR